MLSKVAVTSMIDGVVGDRESLQAELDRDSNQSQ